MKSSSRIIRLTLFSMVFAFGLPAIGIAQQTELLEGWEEFADAPPFPSELITVPSWRFARGPHVRSAFREVVAEPSQATVRVRADGKKVAYGGIVRSDGWIVTKASQLSGEITCLLADKRRFEAEIVAVSKEYDLALLKIEATDLPVLKFAEKDQPKVGTWLASVGIDRDPVAVGVMSVERREIAHQSGVLGVGLEKRRQGAIVEQVYKNTAAAVAGIKRGDTIVSINNRATRTVEALIRTVKEYMPGEIVDVEIRRRGEVIHLQAKLSSDFPFFQNREEFQNHLGGDLSQRRFGFPDAFQHDTVLKPADCGGPLVNLDSEVVGFNLARAGRTETYAIDSQTLNELVEELIASTKE